MLYFDPVNRGTGGATRPTQPGATGSRTEVSMELSPMHLLLILIIVVVLFGGRRIPELMRGLGQGIKEFKEGMKDQPPSTNPPPTTPGNTPPATEEKK